MAFQEDVSVFFDAVNGFAISATWLPSWGGQIKSSQVILNAPDVIVGAFRQDAINTDYSITFPTAALLGLKEDEFITLDDGKTPTVFSGKYRLHETPVMLSDGAISEARLEKVT